MPTPEETVDAVTAPDPAVGEGAVPVATTPAPVVAPPQQGDNKTMVIPHSAMKRIREEEREAGKQAALDALAKDAGYASHAEFVSALARLKTTSAPAAAPAPAAPTPTQQATGQEDDGSLTPDQVAKMKDSRREQGRYERQLEKMLGERNRYAQSASEWQRKAREAQAEVDAVRAEMQLRTIAAGVGVQDIDYAITLFSREVEKLTPEQAQSFDEKAYFEGLRKNKPLLFGETVQPATTGTGVGGAPTPPKPSQVAAQNGANGRVDARKMSPAEYQAHLRKMGISPV